MSWLPNPKAVLDPGGAHEAQTFMQSFLRGRAGAMGWPCVTNLVARSPENPGLIPVEPRWQQGYVLMPTPNEAHPSTLAYPMRSSDMLRVYESQLTQIQNQLLGTP